MPLSRSGFSPRIGVHFVGKNPHPPTLIGRVTRNSAPFQPWVATAQPRFLEGRG